jgi:ATP-dependent DNA helicase DinG
LQISWTKLPFAARNQQEFSTQLTDWLGRVFYDELPARGYEVREEQIYTAFRMARALADGTTLFAEAGPGTGKTFAYLLPAVCYARFKGKPVLVASATGVLQAQLGNPDGDIQTLSRLLHLDIDARVAADPGEYVCEIKVDRMFTEQHLKGWKAFQDWAGKTATGARTEVPEVADELWGHFGWDPSLPCDTCNRRGHCHVMAARRQYREAGDLVVCDHRLFARDLLTRADRQEGRQMPFLPAYSGVVLDEGHHLPETWQRIQGFQLSARRLKNTLELIAEYADRPGLSYALAEARRASHEFLVKALAGAKRASREFVTTTLAAAQPGEGKRDVSREGAVMAAAERLVRAVAGLQDEMSTEEAMNEGHEVELTLRAFQGRLDDVTAALALFRSEQSVPWVEGEDLWVVPRRPLTLFGPGRLTPGTPLIFSSATLEPGYMARVLQLKEYDASKVGVPFDLGEQALVYQPPADGDEIEQTLAVIRAMNGRTLVLLNSLAEVRRYKQKLAPLALPWTLLFEGDGDRGAMLERFRSDLSSVLFGSTFWEGVDVPGASLSCCAIPHLPFPAHDPLIRERRAQAEALGEDPTLAVDVPEMLLKLKQGAGRLIRTTQDRGVLALLDRSFLAEPWADDVLDVLPEDAERTDDLERVAGFAPLEQAK